MCSCSRLPDLIEVAEGSSKFEEGLDVLEFGNWVRLMACRSCHQLWRVDVAERLQVQFAVKLHERANWVQFDAAPLAKQFLLASRGGLQVSGECIRAGCSSRPVRSVAYCLEHLYEIGWRK